MLKLHSSGLISTISSNERIVSNSFAFTFFVVGMIILTFKQVEDVEDFSRKVESLLAVLPVYEDDKCCHTMVLNDLEGIAQ